MVLNIDDKLNAALSKGLAQPKYEMSYLDSLEYKPMLWGNNKLKPVEKVPGRRSFAEDMQPCQICSKPTNINNLHHYNDKRICDNCIKNLGLIKCRICGRLTDYNQGRKCGCGTMHCDTCHRTCSLCNAHCCEACSWRCDKCNFNGCKNCYRVDHSGECYYCGNGVCDKSSNKQGKMTCGEIVCAMHYNKHMERCYMCNPPTCVKCSISTSHNCYACKRYCCAECLVECSNCSYKVCENCSGNFTKCKACDNMYCGACSLFLNRPIPCNGELACNVCYKKHHDTCPTCSMVTLCAYDSCLEPALICKCGKPSMCKKHGSNCSVCAGAICEECRVNCFNCNTHVHSTCATKSKCGEVMCSPSCAKSHNYKCKAAKQQCSCGSMHYHTALLRKCSKCNNSVCYSCAMICLQCKALMCKSCAQYMVKTACYIYVCDQACADKHNANCTLAKSVKVTIPESFEISSDTLNAIDDIFEAPDVIKLAEPVVKKISAINNYIDTTQYVALVDQHLKGASNV